jgi:hypothetical protein
VTRYQQLVFVGVANQSLLAHHIGKEFALGHFLAVYFLTFQSPYGG